MKKYDQLKEWFGRRYCKYYRIGYNDLLKGIVVGYRPIDTYDNISKPLLIVYPDDTFEINLLTYWCDQYTDKAVLLSCMPYPVIVEKRRNGLHINGFKWQPEGMLFDSQGECLNLNPVIEDTKEKRKQFNKYMLNWTKIQIAMIRMTQTPTTLDSSWNATKDIHYHKIDHAYQLFLVTPSQETWNYIKKIAWETSSIKKTVQNFRKRFQDELYEEYLEREHPVIKDFKK